MNININNSFVLTDIQVINGASDECARTLLENSGSAKCLNVILSQMSNSHGIVRQKSAEYALLLLQNFNTYNTQLSADHVDMVTKVARKAVEDSDGKARKAGREIVLHLETYYPNQGERLFNSFASAVQRAIVKDRKARLNAGNKKNVKNNKNKRTSSGLAEARRNHKRQNTGAEFTMVV